MRDFTGTMACTAPPHGLRRPGNVYYSTARPCQVELQNFRCSDARCVKRWISPQSIQIAKLPFEAMTAIPMPCVGSAPSGSAVTQSRVASMGDISQNEQLPCAKILTVAASKHFTGGFTETRPVLLHLMGSVDRVSCTTAPPGHARCRPPININVPHAM